MVHGGTKYAAPMRLDAAALNTLADLVPLAPFHQPHNLLPIRVIAERRPGLPQVACFDTAFHQGTPPLAQAFALPPSIDRPGRRVATASTACPTSTSPQCCRSNDARAAAGRTVVLHLGNGASMCAMSGGKSVATTMSFTALDGLPMGTRSGTLDPGVVLYLMQELKMDARRRSSPCSTNESGLLGVSGVSSDMRALLESADPRAQFARSICSFIASAASSARSPPRSAGSMRSCLPPVSASTR